MKFIFWWLVAALTMCCACCQAFAEPPVIRMRDIADAGSLEIGRQVSDYRDASGKLGFEQIIEAQRERRFAPLTQDRPNFGYDRAHHWLRFTIDPGPRAAHLMLEVGLASLDLVELHAPQPEGSYGVQKAGDQLPWNARAAPGIWCSPPPAGPTVFLPTWRRSPTSCPCRGSSRAVWWR